MSSNHDSRSAPASPSVSTARRFELGRVVATPAALALLDQAGVNPMTLLARHAAGSWGELCAEDWEANEKALATGGRVFSSYEVGVGINATKVWILIEAGRQVSTILTPSDY